MIPTEAQEGRALVAYLRINGYVFTHIANETGSGHGARFQGIRNKQQGTSKGFPDYLVITKSNKLIAIEMKRIKGSVTSPEQKVWIGRLTKAGIPAKVCKGFEQAKEFIESLEK